MLTTDPRREINSIALYLQDRVCVTNAALVLNNYVNIWKDIELDIGLFCIHHSLLDFSIIFAFKF